MPTQLRATPPARQRFFIPVSRWIVRVMRSMTSSVTSWTDRARSMSRWAQQGFRLSRRPAEEPVELLVGHGEACAVVEVVHVEPERAVLLEIHQLRKDEIPVLRLAVGGKPHDLVLAGVDLEARVVGEGRVQQAQRMRELELREDRHLVVPAEAVACRRPFAHTVDGEKGRLPEGEGKKADAAWDS